MWCVVSSMLGVGALSHSQHMTRHVLSSLCCPPAVARPPDHEVFHAGQAPSPASQSSLQWWSCSQS